MYQVRCFFSYFSKRFSSVTWRSITTYLLSQLACSWRLLRYTLLLLLRCAGTLLGWLSVLAAGLALVLCSLCIYINEFLEERNDE